jgi:hypothetical protein
VINLKPAINLGLTVLQLLGGAEGVIESAAAEF